MEKMESETKMPLDDQTALTSSQDGAEEGPGSKPEASELSKVNDPKGEHDQAPPLSTENHPDSETTTPIKHKRKHSPPKWTVAKILYDFAAHDYRELGVREGDKVVVLEKGDRGWTLVFKVGTRVQGWVPTSYIDFLI